MTTMPVHSSWVDSACAVELLNQNTEGYQKITENTEFVSEQNVLDQYNIIETKAGTNAKQSKYWYMCSSMNTKCKYPKLYDGKSQKFNAHMNSCHTNTTYQCPLCTKVGRLNVH